MLYYGVVARFDDAIHGTSIRYASDTGFYEYYPAFPFRSIEAAMEVAKRWKSQSPEMLRIVSINPNADAKTVQNLIG
jgi:hypothetical protein